MTVYYPIVTSEKFVTVEARLDQLLREKSELARHVLRPSNERLVRAEEFLDLI